MLLPILIAGPCFLAFCGSYPQEFCHQSIYHLSNTVLLEGISDELTPPDEMHSFLQCSGSAVAVQ